MFEVSKRTCVTPVEQLLWNISEQLKEISAKLDKPSKPQKDPPPPLGTAGQPNQ